jgi:hypothetical protein
MPVLHGRVATTVLIKAGNRMKIAYVSSDKQGETDLLLTAVAEQLSKDGCSLSGVVKEMNYASSFENGCDMKVRVLPDGPVIKITQDLGAGSGACRLDPGAIANAVSNVETGPLAQADLFILNKFGPEEMAGHGFVSAIGSAASFGVPVLVGVSRPNIPAFVAFSGELAQALPPDFDAILNWSRAEI